MARSKPKPIQLKKPRDPEAIRWRRRIALHTTAIILFVGGSALGFHFLRRHVEHRLVFPSTPPQIVLKHRPPWMSDFLARRIADLARPAGTHSAFDRQMLIDTYAVLRSNPWIRSIRQIRRVYGLQPGDTLEIDCEYRAPVALVHWGDYYWLIDGEGVKLPEAYKPEQVPHILFGRDKQLSIRIIDGVRQPPAEPGCMWSGEDLAAGLEMVKLLFDKPYAQEIIKVDVSNFSGRKDPKEAQLVLVTKHSTQVRWGRPVSSRDFFVEVPPAQKLNYLQAIYNESGRVDGNHPWIDIRFDAVTVPNLEAAKAEFRR